MQEEDKVDADWSFKQASDSWSKPHLGLTVCSKAGAALHFLPTVYTADLTHSF